MTLSSSESPTWKSLASRTERWSNFHSLLSQLLTYWARRVAQPLYKLTEKDAPFVWSNECEGAFQRLKRLLMRAPILAYPNFSRDFLLETDASGVGLGAVLSQSQGDKTIRPISFASRPHERNYGISELEALGVVWAVRHFRHYLYGHQCTVYTDHEALKSLLNTPHPSGKLARWGMAIQELDVKIEYRPGKENGQADAPSRYPISTQSDGPTETVPVLVSSIQTEIQSGEETEIQSGEETEIQSGEETEIQSGEETEIQSQSGEETEIQSGEETEIQSGEETEIQSGEETEIQSQSGEETEIQSGEETEIQSGEETEIQSGEETEIQSGEETDIQSREETEIQTTTQETVTQGGETPTTAAAAVTQDTVVTPTATVIQDTVTQDGETTAQHFLSERQYRDPELRKVIQYLQSGVLPEDDVEARKLTMNEGQYSLVGGTTWMLTRV